MFGLMRAATLFIVQPALAAVRARDNSGLCDAGGVTSEFLSVWWSVTIPLECVCDSLAPASGSCPLHFGKTLSKLPPQPCSVPPQLTSWFFDPWLFLAFILPSEHQVFFLVPNLCWGRRPFACAILQI